MVQLDKKVAELYKEYNTLAEKLPSMRTEYNALIEGIEKAEERLAAIKKIHKSLSEQMSKQKESRETERDEFMLSKKLEL